LNLKIRTYNQVAEAESNLPDQVAEAARRVAVRLQTVQMTLAVMSGKGGVGKSMVSALLAASFARRGMKTGLLDADLNGPSTAHLLGVDGDGLAVGPEGIEPARSSGDVRIMSMSLILDQDAALSWREPRDSGYIWRGAQERRALREFLADTAWGRLDIMVIDLPPGGPRLADLHAMVPDLTGVVVVTAPGRSARDAVARSLDLARARSAPVAGLIENMSGVVCSGCGETTRVHEGGEADALAARFGVPVLGALPLDSGLAAAADGGRIEDWTDREGAAGSVRDLVRQLALRTEQELERLRLEHPRGGSGG